MRVDMSASISSKKITDGCRARETSNSAWAHVSETPSRGNNRHDTFMSFSPSPRYLLVTAEEVMEKKQNPDSVATAFASSVLPVPVAVKKHTKYYLRRGETWRPEEQHSFGRAAQASEEVGA